MQPRLRSVFNHVILFLENLEDNAGFKYIIIGGMLTPIYAESRQTMDIDVVVSLALSSQNKKILIERLQNDGFEPPTTWEDTFAGWRRRKLIQVLAVNLSTDSVFYYLEHIAGQQVGKISSFGS